MIDVNDIIQETVDKRNQFCHFVPATLPSMTTLRTVQLRQSLENLKIIKKTTTSVVCALNRDNNVTITTIHWSIMQSSDQKAL